jgi:hypothetical protein
MDNVNVEYNIIFNSFMIPKNIIVTIQISPLIMFSPRENIIFSISIRLFDYYMKKIN